MDYRCSSLSCPHTEFLCTWSEIDDDDTLIHTGNHQPLCAIKAEYLPRNTYLGILTLEYLRRNIYLGIPTPEYLPGIPTPEYLPRTTYPGLPTPGCRCTWTCWFHRSTILRSNWLTHSHWCQSHTCGQWNLAGSHIWSGFLLRHNLRTHSSHSYTCRWPSEKEIKDSLQDYIHIIHAER